MDSPGQYLNAAFTLNSFSGSAKHISHRHCDLSVGLSFFFLSETHETSCQHQPADLFTSKNATMRLAAGPANIIMLP